MHIHSVLSVALENAVEWELSGRNVAKRVKRPRIEWYESQTLTVKQAITLLEVARGSRLEALLLLALTTGMRRGELLALRWSDVDLDSRVLHVRCTMNFIGGLGYVEGEPKTRAGWRDIVLPDVAVEALKQHRVYQGEARVKAGLRWREQGIVFTNIYGGFFSPSQVRKLFKGLLKKAGLPGVRLHDLRHSVATILRASGVDLKVIQGLLGHSSMAITADIYSHVLPEERGEVASKMDDFFK